VCVCVFVCVCVCVCDGDRVGIVEPVRQTRLGREYCTCERVRLDRECCTVRGCD
jgi:hypothetical protein